MGYNQISRVQLWKLDNHLILILGTVNFNFIREYNTSLYCFSTVYRITCRIERKENDEQGTTEFITFLREIERLLLIFIMK